MRTTKNHPKASSYLMARNDEGLIADRQLWTEEVGWTVDAGPGGEEAKIAVRLKKAR